MISGLIALGGEKAAVTSSELGVARPKNHIIQIAFPLSAFFLAAAQRSAVALGRRVSFLVSANVGVGLV